VVVRVLEANAVIDFPDNRLKYCLNDAPFIITGANLANVIGSFAISGGAGLVDNHDNTATIDPSLLGVNEYTITYTYFDQTSLFVTNKFEVGNPPVADFSWETECFKAGQPIKFMNTSTSTFGNIIGSSWKIYTSTGYDTTSTRDMAYTFPYEGNHVVELQVSTSYGCSNSIPKVFALRPTKDLSKLDYFENFDLVPLDWQSGTSQSVTFNSWTIGDPSKGFSGPYSGDYCWYTQIPIQGSPREQSWVTSPCFDFKGIKRPMLKLRVWRLFNSNRDGANLQFTADSGKTWTLLGQIGDGMDWFNHYNILGNPGGSSIGWSDEADAGWKEVRHSLDMLKGKTNVQFRIAYGSDGTAHNNNGIAFDDFWIGQRNRTTLLEHFTNASDNQSKDADLVLNNLVGADSLNTLDLQYHTSFPGDDPFNEQEPFIPGARVLYYGLPSVPYTILNGGAKPKNRFDYDLNELDPTTIYVESLNDSKFDLNVTSTLENGILLSINTQLTAKEDIPASELTVHVAVVERKVTGVTGNNGETEFRNVVKTLLPDAAGTTLYKSWARGDNGTITDSWQLKNVKDPKELRVISFVQDESTGEILQAAVDTSDFQTGLNDELTGRGPGNRFIVFPNPASDQIFIRFDEPVAKQVKIEMYNNLGGLIYSGNIYRGENEIEIPAGDCADGIYIIRALTSDQVWGIRKLTINR
jgi:hypothetical protein